MRYFKFFVVLAMLVTVLVGWSSITFSQDNYVSVKTCEDLKSATGKQIVNYWAVMVGIADYPGTVNDLNYTDDDAIDSYNILLSYSTNWSAGNIILLIDAAATKNGIQSAINGIGSLADANDVVLFFFSGHGTNGSDVAPLDEVDGQDEYLCAYNANIRDDELGDWLGALPTTNVIVIIDACFSGGMIKRDGFTIKSIMGTPNGIVKKGDGFATDLRKKIGAKDLDDNAGCVVLTACDDHEVSWEFSEIQHGLFTYTLITPRGVAYDANQNGEFSAEEMYLHANTLIEALYNRRPLLELLLQQHPQLYDDFPAGNPQSNELTLVIPSAKATVVHVAVIPEQVHALARKLTVTLPRSAYASEKWDYCEVTEDDFTNGVMLSDFGSTLPVTFSLDQNYPNPFNSLTTISYSLPKSADLPYGLVVNLEIYNVFGRLVKSFNLTNNSTESDGQSPLSQVVWDGKDDAGKEVVSGVYFYRLQAGSHSDIKKLTLIR